VKFLREQDMVEVLNEFENGCILMHRGAWVVMLCNC